jgi:hypothetical protein
VPEEPHRTLADGGQLLPMSAGWEAEQSLAIYTATYGADHPTTEADRRCLEAP